MASNINVLYIIKFEKNIALFLRQLKIIFTSIILINWQ